MEKSKGVSVLLFVQQIIFGMHCTFYIALHCHSLRSRKVPDNSHLEMEVYSLAWVEAKWKMEAFEQHSTTS